jgi:hypothetical protein
MKKHCISSMVQLDRLRRGDLVIVDVRDVKKVLWGKLNEYQQIWFPDIRISRILITCPLHTIVQKYRETRLSRKGVEMKVKNGWVNIVGGCFVHIWIANLGKSSHFVLIERSKQSNFVSNNPPYPILYYSKLSSPSRSQQEQQWSTSCSFSFLFDGSLGTCTESMGNALNYF